MTAGRTEYRVTYRRANWGEHTTDQSRLFQTRYAAMRFVDRLVDRTGRPDLAVITTVRIDLRRGRSVAGRVVSPPESGESRDRWRAALDQYLARKARTAALRASLAAARQAGKAIRHRNRLRRGRRAGNTDRRD